jgi:hypothetical protein
VTTTVLLWSPSVAVVAKHRFQQRRNGEMRDSEASSTKQSLAVLVPDRLRLGGCGAVLHVRDGKPSSSS